MDSEKLSFLDENQSVASLVTPLHDYFKHSHSHCKVKRSQLLSQLDKVSGEQEQAVFTDRVLHSRVVMETLGMASEGYRVYQETESRTSGRGEHGSVPIS